MRLTLRREKAAEYREGAPWATAIWPVRHPAARSAAPDSATLSAASGGPATATACSHKHSFTPRLRTQDYRGTRGGPWTAGAVTAMPPKRSMFA